MNLREWALPVYTILMQFAVGTLIMLWCLRGTAMRHLDASARDRILRKPILVVVGAILVAMVGSHLHLSRPQLSFLAMLNLGQSWLSREVLLTIIMLALCVALAGLIWWREGRQRLKSVVGWLAVACGLAVIYCMAHLYLIPTQPVWDTPITVLVFFSTALLLGTASAVALLIMDSIFSASTEPDLQAPRADLLRRSAVTFAGLAVIGLVIILALNAAHIGLMRAGDQYARISLDLLFGLYAPLFGARLVTLVAGVVLLVLTVVRIYRQRRTPEDIVYPIHLACLLVVVAEILGRFLFYATHIRVGV